MENSKVQHTEKTFEFPQLQIVEKIMDVQLTEKTFEFPQTLKALRLNM